MATTVSVLADFEAGEGWMTLQWPDALYGDEGLRIDLDGHCSRNMPIRSGYGPPDLIVLQRNSMRIRFNSALAKRLDLDEEIEVRFQLDDDDFQSVQRFVKHLNGVDSL